VIPPDFESALLVFQNPVAGRKDAYDDWYTNVHIRDAMRLEGAIATQRFIVSEDQPLIAGKRIVPGHWAHTIYEWQSAAKSVEGHRLRATTPQMQISRDGDFRNLRDYFYRPAVLSHGWSREAGFRRGDDVLTALIVPPPDAEEFVSWFRDTHLRAILALDGIASAALFTLHSEQSLPTPARFAMAAIYSLDRRAAGLRAWSGAQSRDGDGNLLARAAEVEPTCWMPRTPRLRAEDVASPTQAAAAEEQRARAAHHDRYLSAAELTQLLQHG
jgi:hypothetical protein